MEGGEGSSSSAAAGIVPRSAMEAVKQTLALLKEVKPQLEEMLSLAEPDVLAQMQPLKRAKVMYMLAEATTTIFNRLPPALTSDEFRAYFETYGPVSDAVIMIDQTTQRPRGFGFVSFDSEDSVDLDLHKTFHDLKGKQVEVKRALPKYAGYGGSGEGRVD